MIGNPESVPDRLDRSYVQAAVTAHPSVPCNTENIKDMESGFNTAEGCQFYSLKTDK